MIVGRFGNTTGRPYVSGRLLLPRLQLSTNLSFLVDTGADCSTLMPTDGIKMSLNYGALQDPIVVGGMGGNAVCFQEYAVVAFDESNRSLIQYYFIQIKIPEPQPDLLRMPPMIGRDILDRWHMSYDPSQKKLAFTVRSADYTVKTP